ncbi:MAG: restriction endonuclease [Planctomycetota bacterium]
MPHAWMIRSGRGSAHVDDFVSKGVAAIGWSELGELAGNDRDGFMTRVQAAYPGKHRSAVANDATVLHRFVQEMQEGDAVVTYDSERRLYHLGTIAGPYRHQPELIPGLPQTRRVTWSRTVNRDDLRRATRNSLSSTLSLFRLSPEVLADLQGDRSASFPTVELDEEVIATEDTIDDTAERSLELIKDQVTELDEDEMEELMAGVLRAMGYKAQVSPTGPDRGVDVTASPDGLGLEQPRIKAEVKHRPKTPMGAQEIRNFIATLRLGDSGLFLSTGGFTREARYEAERATLPVSLISLDDLVRLITEHYHRFDAKARILIPLEQVWWPAR